MEIKKAAEREMKRMKAVFGKLKRKGGKKTDEFFNFAHNYFTDGIYFFEKGKFIESFEAFIISWAYIDAGLKLGYFSAPREQKKWFTV